jgi:hypothetical protein
MTYALVSCVKTKRSVASTAETLYVSPWFRKARGYARARSDAWRILSAEHGVLAPHEVVAPYDTTLHDMAADARRAWSRRVVDQLKPLIDSEDEVIVLAGVRYREHLMSALRTMARRVHVPLAGLGIGEQLGFLKRAGF